MVSYEVLDQAVTELGQVTGLEQIQAVVRTAARQLVSASGATFVLLEGDKCFYADEDAIGPLWRGQRFPLKQCITGWTMLNRRPAVIPDILTDQRIPQEAYAPTFVRSLAAVPIGAENPRGAIGVYWAYEYTATDKDIAALTDLGEATATAMQRVLPQLTGPATGSDQAQRQVS
jgi:GAF domain-containing protein